MTLWLWLTNAAIGVLVFSTMRTPIVDAVTFMALGVVVGMDVMRTAHPRALRRG